MNYITRNADIVLGGNTLEDLHTFKNFPVFMGCTTNDPSEDILADMNWKISPESGMIQLNPLLPLEVIYSEEHGSGTMGAAWNEHHQSFAEFINKYAPKQVLEIGGLHGILAQKILQLNNEIKWTIIEPNPRIPEDLPVEVITRFFDNTFKSEKQFDAIVHSHVLEHIYNPDEFMEHKASFMQEGNLLIFTLPNMEAMLKKKYTNCINFEHTAYLTEPYIEFYLAKYGFELLEKEYFKEEHSIFYCAKKTNNQVTFKLPNTLYKDNKQVFEDYINTHQTDVSNINKLIEDTKLPVYLFGAHIFSQYLISFGLNTKNIECILDNDPTKQSKRLYGTNLLCNSPKILKDVKQAVVILRAAGYNEEIKNDILNNINPNIIFI
jgi:hypothetical protein